MNQLRERLVGARSVLFVPGDRPDRFEKAIGSGCDAIALDLEDAVAPEAKHRARDAVDRWLTATGALAIVRINGVDTDWCADDLAMVAGHRCAVMLPKSSSGEQVAAIGDRLGFAIPVIALIETAAGIVAAAEVCAAEGVLRVAFGSIDLASELGIDPDDRPALQYARSALVLASAAAGRPAPLDGVTTILSDDTAVVTDAAQAAGLGFGGKLCIHPRQVAAVNAQFSPSRDEQDWAQKVLDTAEDGTVGVVDGRMVDKPVVDRARGILARAGKPRDPISAGRHLPSSRSESAFD